MSRHKTAHRAPAAAPPPVQGQNRRERSGSLSRRLQLVTALLLTAEEFPGELGESFGAACAAVGVEPATSGYGLVLAQDEAAASSTHITPKVNGASRAQIILGLGVGCAHQPPETRVEAGRPRS